MLNQQKQPTLKREILALATELRQDKHVMDNIWDRNPSKLEVTGRCDGFGKKTPNDHTEPTKVAR